MKVKARKVCFVNGRLQNIGDVFEITPEKFNDKVMEKVGDEMKVTKPTIGPSSVASMPMPASGTGREQFVKEEDRFFSPSISNADKPKKAARGRSKK